MDKILEEVWFLVLTFSNVNDTHNPSHDTLSMLSWDMVWSGNGPGRVWFLFFLKRLLIAIRIKEMQNLYNWKIYIQS